MNIDIFRHWCYLYQNVPCHFFLANIQVPTLHVSHIPWSSPNSFFPSMISFAIGFIHHDTQAEVPSLHCYSLAYLYILTLFWSYSWLCKSHVSNSQHHVTFCNVSWLFWGGRGFGMMKPARGAAVWHSWCRLIP